MPLPTSPTSSLACRTTCRTSATYLFAVLLSLSGGPTCADEPAANVTSFRTAAVPLLRQYCFDCHNNDGAEANVNLQQFALATDLASEFATSRKVIEALRSGHMPPDDANQPSAAERRQLIRGVTDTFTALAAAGAGDPGPVIMRRLTSAEYAYTIEDLTGLPLNFDALFATDAVGGEGFTNVGAAQFVQDSTLERYLEAAKHVASHAVIGAGPLQFYADPGRTGQELSAIHRIQDIYRRHGFRSGAGEGGEAFGLERYPRAFYVAWQMRYRKELGRQDATLLQLARQAGLEPGFVTHIDRVLRSEQPSFPTSVLVEMWRNLPPPSEKNQTQVRNGCRDIFMAMRGWQQTLASATNDQEEAAILSAEAIQVSERHRFAAGLRWPKGAKRARVILRVEEASHWKQPAFVIWKQPRLQFRGADRRRQRPLALADLLVPSSNEKVRWGNHPNGSALEADEFVLPSGSNVTLEFEVPDEAISAELTVEVVLDRDSSGSAVVRCSITDGDIEGETAAEKGAHSTILADDRTASFAMWKQGVVEFGRQMPEISHREPAPSDRDPIPAPFDNTYNSVERNRFHYIIKYHRDDRFLVEHLLDQRQRQQLDEAWVDLLTSFDYHETYARFVQDKFAVEPKDRLLRQWSDEALAKLPEPAQRHLVWLRNDYARAQQLLREAENGHIDDVVRFATAAWRRPLAERESERLRDFYTELRSDKGLPHSQAVRALLTRVLMSPAFLYRIEPGSSKPTADASTSRQALDSWQLASRLSYFLWSSTPDAELREAARSGKILEKEELARQVRRMLHDPKSRRFATEFFGQWFGFYRFDSYGGVDQRRYPEFTESLRQAMYEEAVAFFAYIVQAERPIDEILTADYAFLNRELADHYQIAIQGLDRGGVPVAASGEHGLTRVDQMTDHQRGGLLGLGAVLTTTSAPTRTSPVKRGDWVLRRILGTAVPPPPADAGSISAEETAKSGRSIRELLIAHRREPTCANCHARFDAFGFGLENFDAIGRWRDTYRDGQPIDTTATLSSGARITGPASLRVHLLQNKRDFHSTLSKKLLGYALGRGEIVSDRQLLEELARRADNNGSMVDLIIAIVESPQFRYRRSVQNVPSQSASRSEQNR